MNLRLDIPKFLHDGFVSFIQTLYAFLSLVNGVIVDVCLGEFRALVKSAVLFHIYSLSFTC